MGHKAPTLLFIMPKVVTQDDIIGRFRGVHGDRYDYSKTVYNGSKQKVVVTCKEHGDFLISISNHLRGSGCKRCACDSRNRIIHDRCKKEFEAKARKVHGNKYDYSLVDYDNATTKVRIICPRHGEFLQEPSCHLNGNGCNLCALEHSSISKRNCAMESFEKKARKVHGSKYDYSLVSYDTSHSCVDIICPTHGVFRQTPSNHLGGCGCQRCNLSHMEGKLISWLESSGVEFEFQKKFPWLGLQSLDFYLPRHNIAIECQGIQHFSPIDHFGGNDKFKTQVARDKLKYSLCEEHGLKVVYFCDKENASYYDGTDYIFFTAKDDMMKYIKDNEGKVGE